MDTLALRDAHSVLQVSGMSTGTSMEWAHKVEIPEKEMVWAGRANQGISRVNGGTLVRSSNVKVHPPHLATGDLGGQINP